MKKKNVTRRGFIKGATLAMGAAAFPYIVPANVLGVESVAPSNKIVMGYWGVGNMGSGHVKGFTQKKDVQAVAVCDIDPRKVAQKTQQIDQMYATAKAKDYKSVKGYGDFREFLQHDGLDAVFIALPDHWHSYAAIAAAKAGLDMYCEKPMARSIYEARQMVKAIRQYGRVFQTGSQQRSDRNFRQACELARNGYLGELKEVYANIRGISEPCDLGSEPIPPGYDFKMWLGSAPEASYHSKRVSGDYSCFNRNGWRCWREYAMGHMADWGAHHFDIAQWGMGMDGNGPVEITPGEGKDAKGLVFKYANGLPLIKQPGPQKGSVQFIGTKGWAGASRGGLWVSDEKLRRVKPKEGETKLYVSTDHRQDFLDCVRSRKRPICDVEIGCSSATICALGEIVTLLKRPLKWDHAKGEFIGDAEAQKMVKRDMRAPWKV